MKNVRQLRLPSSIIRDHDILHTLYDPASGTYLQMGGADHTGELETVLGRYSSGFQYDPSKSAWNKLLKALVRIVGTYTAVCLVLIFLWLQIVTPFICKHLPGIQGSLISLILILALISPMLRAIMMKKNHSVEFQQLWNDNKYNRGPLVSLVILRILLCIGLVMLPVARLLNAALGIMLAVASRCYRINDILQTAKEAVDLDGTAFFSNLVAREVEQERKSLINQRLKRTTY